MKNTTPNNEPTRIKEPSLWSLFKRVHKDEEGAVSLETILVVGLIALPILIFLYKYGWPRIKGYFIKGMDDLEESSDDFTGPDDAITPSY